MGSQFRDIAHHDREDMAEVGWLAVSVSENLLIRSENRERVFGWLSSVSLFYPSQDPRQPRDVTPMFRVTLLSSANLSANAL